MSKLFEGGRRRLAIAIVLSLTVWCAARPAHAQGYPVIDTAAIAEVADNLKAAAQQVQQLNAMLTQVQGLVKTVGQQGLPTLLFQEALSQSGISQFGPPVADLLSSAQATWGAIQPAAANFQNLMTQINQLKGQSKALAADFSTFTSAQTWVKGQLTVPPGASVSAVALTRQARSLLAGEAAANAYALALNARQQVAGMAGKTQQLAQQATSANDLRGDMAANTAVMLAMHDEMAQVQALMAAVLEVQSSSRLAEMDPTASSAGSSSSATAASAGAK